MASDLEALLYLLERMEYEEDAVYWCKKKQWILENRLNIFRDNVIISNDGAIFEEYEPTKVIKELIEHDNDFDIDTKILIENSVSIFCLFDEWNWFKVFGVTPEK
ncbi:hypothetical protein AB4114_35450 [Paenibacillus sp. 2RAB27]|uniref:hypothetical protein n=1 Tax=Paenibacillus sp. 2RAB27 TaxID=3232991 RepID=UPI003F95D005